MISQDFRAFCNKIWGFYADNRRSFPWRENPHPYAVFISEIMLQQTQTSRVIEKFEIFLKEFPTFTELAQAPFEKVLFYWKGLGYNRRALNMLKAAQIIVHEHQAELPSNPLTLQELPGIGPATASSMSAFAFNTPTVFIETNIRSVFIHEFFADKATVHDKELLPLIAATVDKERARDWYYALMDYGVFLKKSLPNPSRKSLHHAKQSRFKGSDREIRGKILEFLLNFKKATIEEIVDYCTSEEARVASIVEKMIQEKMIRLHGKTLRVS